jgi:hypothetical protein
MTVQEAVKKILALRELTRECGCITTRTQSKILQGLTPDELVEAAEILATAGNSANGGEAGATGDRGTK